MKKSDLFLMALSNLKNRKTRTKLTVIGVVIGTCAIVIMVSIGVGIDKMMTAQYESDSTLNKITVSQSSDKDNDDKERLPLDDKAIEFFQSLDDVEVVVPKLRVSDCVSVTRGKYKTDWCEVIGVDFSNLERMGYKLQSGDINSVSNNTMLFGKNTVTNFVDRQGTPVKYSINDKKEIVDCEIKPLTDSFTIAPLRKVDGGDGVPVTSFAKKIKVSGILKLESGSDYQTENGILIDISLARQLISDYNKVNSGTVKGDVYNEVCVYVHDMKKVESTTAIIQKAGFSCYSDLESLELTKKAMMVVQLVLGAIGAVSMFVAAFGISNTMVMSVFERTKEIGIMKVLGCSLSDIKAMFLYEAGIIGFLGGTIGIIISYIISISANLIVGLVVNSAGGLGDLKITISSIPPWLALAGIAFAVFVGIIAGRTPANRSVNVSALTAIHNE